MTEVEREGKGSLGIKEITRSTKRQSENARILQDPQKNLHPGVKMKDYE